MVFCGFFGINKYSLDQRWQGLGMRRGFEYNGKYKRILGALGLFCILNVDVVTVIYICVKIHINVHPKE